MGRSQRQERLSPLDWAKIWQSKLARFHNIPAKRRWIFGSKRVIAFLIQQKKAGAPAWKRLKIAEAISLFNAEFLDNQAWAKQHCWAIGPKNEPRFLPLFPCLDSSRFACLHPSQDATPLQSRPVQLPSGSPHASAGCFRRSSHSLWKVPSLSTRR